MQLDCPLLPVTNCMWKRLALDLLVCLNQQEGTDFLTCTVSWGHTPQFLPESQ